MKKNLKEKIVAIIGGCGHVGLPLGIKLSEAGARVYLIDINESATNEVNRGRFPFVEKGGEEQLQTALKNGLLATTEKEVCKDADVIVFVTGTPVDEHLNPKLSDLVKIFDSYEEYFTPAKLVVMRSTLFPGTMQHLHQRLAQRNKKVLLSFCPERVAQGVALDEIDGLPQIISAFDDESFNVAKELFLAVAPEVIKLTPIEAELTKLMANSWRYLEFAIANQFYMIAESNGVDFYRVYDAIRYKYPRASGYKAPGLSAGPCLFKDTMQLASFYDHRFAIGHSAMLVNESLAEFLVSKCEQELGGDLWGKNIGILGLTFKANNDDIRESLSFRVKKTLEFKGANVLSHDPYIDGELTLEGILKESAALILCTPHREYLTLDTKKPLVDCWGIYGRDKLEIFNQ